MGWFNQSWQHGDENVEIRDGEVFHNNKRVGYVEGDKLRIGNDTITVHPHDGDLYVNNRKVGYIDGRGDYHVENKSKFLGSDEWRRNR